MYENIEKIKIINNSKLQINYTHKNNADLKTQLSIEVGDLHTDFTEALNNMQSFCIQQCLDILDKNLIEKAMVNVEEINLKHMATIKFKYSAPEPENNKKFKHYLIETPPFIVEDSGNLKLQTLIDEVHAIIKGKRAQLDLIKDTVLNGNEDESATLEARE